MYNKEFKYIEICSDDHYTLKIIRRISHTIEYNIIEEFTFDDTTVFRELYDGLKG